MRGQIPSVDLALRANNTIVHQPMPIIIGAPRSGTTLLRFILDSHPELAIPPETGFLALGPQFAIQGAALREEFFRAVINFPPDAPGWQDFQIPEQIFWAKLMEINPFKVSEGYRAFYRLYASRFPKPRWGDKTPIYCYHMEAIEAVLPEAYFIHIIRDGRDVSLSLRQMWFSPGWEIETQANHWSNFVLSARRQGAHCSHYMEVHYEQLILNTRATVRRVCGFLDLEYDDAMLSYYERTPQRLQEHEGRSRPDGSLVLTKEQRFRQQQRTTEPPDCSCVFGWKLAMSIEERTRFEAVAGGLLRELGYEIEES
jgi:hypothetical protein